MVGDLVLGLGIHTKRTPGPGLRAFLSLMIPCGCKAAGFFVKPHGGRAAETMHERIDCQVAIYARMHLIVDWLLSTC